MFAIDLPNQIMALSVLDPYAPLIATNPHAYDKESAVNPKESMRQPLEEHASLFESTNVYFAFAITQLYFPTCINLCRSGT